MSAKMVLILRTHALPQPYGKPRALPWNRNRGNTLISAVGAGDVT